MKLITNPDELTPVEERDGYFFKRDDLFSIAGVRGGKARTCWYLAQGAKGLVTAGSRQSPQVNIVAHIAKELGLPCHIHTPRGKLSPELTSAVSTGAKLFQHKAGYNNVIIRRALDDAVSTGYKYIPFGMDCWEAVRQVKKQVKNIPKEAKRIVVPVGSAMSLAGILHGLVAHYATLRRNIPVLGVCVGADPTKRLDKYAPDGWKRMVKLVRSRFDYHKPFPILEFEGVKLDSIYEAKCQPYIERGDLLWVIGIRESEISPKTTNR